MNTKSGCGRLDLSAFKGEGFRPVWSVGPNEAAHAEPKTWRPAELERPDPTPLLEPRPS